MEIITEQIRYEREVVNFRGYRFTRKVKDNPQHGEMYFIGVVEGRKISLHRFVWECFNGPIPDGYEIHHVDTNPSNNEIDNLECLSPPDHRALSRGYTSHRRKEHLKRIRPLAAAAMARPEVREAMAERHRAWWRERGYVTFTCESCAGEFASRSARPPKFCSNDCKSRARRASGVDQVERSCLNCGDVFMADKYSRTKNCSRSCAQSYAWKKRRAGL